MDSVFFTRIQALCNRDGIEISNVLKALGLSTSKGTAWKEGAIPKGDILLKLANYFHVSTDYLLGNTDDPTPAGKEKAPTHEGERELPHAEYREVLAEGGMRLLMDADAKIPEEHVEEIVEFIKMKQRKYGR